MSVRLGLLALLDQGACYGYQLRSELDWRTGGTGPINVGQIYNTLDRLERDKLVRKTGTNNYYEITLEGSTLVAEWFAAPSPQPELVAKIALAATLPGVDVDRLIRIQRGAAPGLTAGRPPSGAAELAAAVVSAGARAAAQSEVEFLDRVEALLALGISRAPLTADLPKRGRPAKSADRLLGLPVVVDGGDSEREIDG